VHPLHHFVFKLVPLAEVWKARGAVVKSRLGHSVEKVPMYHMGQTEEGHFYSCMQRARASCSNHLRIWAITLRRHYVSPTNELVTGR
jgi:hypothetical protein